ncbi:MAG: hypothetical protein U9O54_01215, partial [Chloroflexota bacterium]|nr:hypothetical protein [Chloroflexota bacterium]
MLVALGIGLLIGLLVNGLREKASEPSSEIPDLPSSPSPPLRGLQQVGIIWKDKKSKLFLEIDDELISAADFFL